MKQYDVVIIGGGIVGLATALHVTRTTQSRVLVLEAESGIARHQTGHNSGVIHSGLYYKPGSLKARNCADGREALYRFCAEQGISHERCGKVVVAVSENERPALLELERRGLANGLEGVRRLSREELREVEPEASGVEALYVPQTGIVDFPAVAAKYAELMQVAGGELRTSAAVQIVRRMGADIVLDSTAGSFSAHHVINCAGLQCDRIARLCGSDPGLRIVPFRGEYYQLRPESHHLVRNLIYPVPDPRFPFLGVHFTRMIGGGVEAGPNAVLALARHGYNRASFSATDTLDLLGFPGFWQMARKYWRMGAGEFHRSFSKGAFVAALQRLMPALTAADLVPGGAGVRAQAVTAEGALVDDFRIESDERFIHVLNAPSPAATASLSIGRTIAELAAQRFGLS